MTQWKTRHPVAQLRSALVKAVAGAHVLNLIQIMVSAGSQCQVQSSCIEDH